MNAILALLAGAAIAMQAAMNSQLGSLLKNPMLAATFAFAISAILLLVSTYIVPAPKVSFEQLAKVPNYLWGAAILSAIGVTTMYFLIPKMGVGKMMTFALTGQLVASMLISHFGWFHSIPAQISGMKIVGLLALITGVVLINTGWSIN